MEEVISNAGSFHLSFTSFNNLSNSFSYRNVTFPVSRRLLCISFLLQGKIDGTAPSNRVLRPTPKETLISFAWKLNSQMCVVFLILKVSVYPFLLYWPIVFFKLWKGLHFQEMPDFCLCLSFEALPHWGTQQYIPKNSWRSFQKRLLLDFFFFCNVFNISARFIY